MANNTMQFKRTSTSGLLPNTTNTANNSYIPAGSFAVNLTDKKVIASDGALPFEVGANLSSLFLGGALTANGSNGSSGQVLTSNSTGVYWSTVSGGPGGSVNTAEAYVWTNTHTFNANVTIAGNTTSTLVVGTTSIGATVNSTYFGIGNSTSNTAANSTTIFSPTAIIGTAATGFKANSTLISVGNTTQNTFANGTHLQVGATAVQSLYTFGVYANNTGWPHIVYSNGQLQLGMTNGLTVDTAGKIAMNGFTPSGWNYEVASSANSRSDAFRLWNFNNAANAAVQMHVYAGSGVGTQSLMALYSNITASYVGTTSNTPFYQMANNVLVTTAASNGNFGIGNTTPADKLSVAGSINITTTGSTLKLGDAATAVAISANGSNGASGQVLTSNGTSVYWSTASGGPGGSPGGSNTQVQFNNSGAFGGSSGLTYDVVTNLTSLGGTDPGLKITGIVEEHTVPASNELLIYSKSIAGRMLPKWIGPSGFDTPFQATFAQNKIGWWNPPGNAATVPGVVGFTAPTAVGTAQTRGVAATNIYTRTRRLGYNSAATAGQAGGHFSPAGGIQFSLGDGLGLGGFYYVCRFGSADTLATAISFVGLSSSSATPVVTASPATLTQSIGIGCATGDTNYSIYYGGTVAQTPIALGVGFPAKTNSTDLIELILFAATNVNNAVGWRATNLSKYASFTAAISGTTLTSSLLTAGTISIGQTITGGNIAAGTKITAGSGTSWTVSISQTVSATLVNAVTVESGTLTAATAGTQLPSSSTFMGHRAYRTNNATATLVSIDIISVYIETDT